VTSSVEMAGVMVVFALLISPALISMSIGKGILLVNAWIIGTVLNLAAILLSYNFDLPTGYAIVFCNALAAAVVNLISNRTKAEQPA
jgi:zinc/manganese transport system permease protein